MVQQVYATAQVTSGPGDVLLSGGAYTWGPEPRSRPGTQSFAPDTISAVFVLGDDGWEITKVSASGPLVRANGTVSGKVRRDSRMSWSGVVAPAAPQWVHDWVRSVYPGTDAEYAELGR
jgi:hypothetical protein